MHQETDPKMPDNYMNKNTKKTLLIIAIIFAVVLIFMLLLLRLFDTQYNLKTGISHYMNAIYDEHQEKEYIGSLDGYYITDGKAIKIKCEKQSRRDQTIYKDLDGNEIKVNDGNTFIQIVPIDANITIE